MPKLDHRFFESLKTLQPLMEEYNIKLIEAFEDFLSFPSQDTLIPVFDMQKDSLASPAGKCYEHVNMIFIISDIALRELSIGLIPITHGTNSYTDAIDKYRRTVFMVRRHIFMINENDSPMLDEALEYLMYENISPITLSYIINNEPGESVDNAVSYWVQFFRLLGLDRNADILVKLQEKKV